MTNYLEEIEVAMRAKTGIVWLRTPEEVRVERSLVPIADRLGYELWTWTVTKGVERVGQMNQIKKEETRPFDGAMDWLSAYENRAILIAKDAGAWLSDPIAKRKARDIHLELQSMSKEKAKQILIVDQEAPGQGLNLFTFIECSLPDREEMGSILESFLAWAPEKAVRDVKKNGNRDDIIGAMLGLTSEDAGNALARSLAATGFFKPDLISKEKAQVVKGSGLEWYEPDERGMDAVGGMDLLKVSLVSRKKAFGREAKKYGLPAPKGFLLVGIPGCGKSLTAKCIANTWNLPLLRMDVGALFGKYVGESEGKIRTALQTAEAIAPCILWVDEIEKAFAQGSGETDGGTSTRVFGAFLTWMQERKDGVFIIATSNDVSKLPPEFVRAGRWDDLWFVSLPNVKEREEISNVMAKKFEPCKNVDGYKVAEMSDGYTGSEIEQAFIDAMYVAFEDDAREVETLDVCEAVKSRVPLSQTMREKIEDLKKWAKGRAREASSSETVSNKSGRSIE